MKIYLGGTFDLIHVGHYRLLTHARKIVGYEGKVIVSLNTDEFIKKFKGKPPIQSYKERKIALELCRLVDEVVENTGGKDSKPAILKVKPNFILVGSDWAKKDYYAQMGFTQKWLDDHFITLLYVPYTDWISTTKLKEKIWTNFKQGI